MPTVRCRAVLLLLVAAWHFFHRGLGGRPRLAVALPQREGGAALGPSGAGAAHAAAAGLLVAGNPLHRLLRP